MISVTAEERKSIRRVSPGEFVKFRYRDSEGNHSEREVLALAYDNDAQLLHGLDLSKFSDQNLVDVGSEISQMANEQDDFTERYVETGEVLLEEVTDSTVEQWYETEYSPDIFESNPYRTFRKDGIRNLRSTTAEIT